MLARAAVERRSLPMSVPALAGRRSSAAQHRSRLPSDPDGGQLIGAACAGPIESNQFRVPRSGRIGTRPPPGPARAATIT